MLDLFWNWAATHQRWNALFVLVLAYGMGRVL